MKLLTSNFKIFTFLGLLLSCSELFSQGNESYMNIIPPSPNASELGKYIDIPVNLYTGIPNISIPLFEIKGRDISIPITLNYHASGIKVEQMATWVGLGWSLNAGGVVTRTVRGVPDDRWEDSDDMDKFCKGFFYSSGPYWGIISSSATEQSIADNAWRVSKGGWDTEPDMYYYNFSDHQGQFFFDNDKNIHLTSENDLKISHAMEDYQPITSFNIVDEKGISYLFDNVESTDDNSPLGYPFNSSWYLSRIQSQFEKVDFTYQEEEILEEKTRSQVRVYVNEGGEVSTTPRYGFTPEIRVKCKRLSRIDWSGGYIIFEASTFRQDVGHHANDTKFSKALDKIYIYNTQGTLIKQYNLNYSYFNGADCSAEPTESYLCKRLRLNSITEVNGVASKPPYTFFYDETPLSPRNSFQQDHWGYFNGNGASTLIPKVWAYPSDYSNPLYKSGYSIYRRSSYTGNEYELSEGADRSPVEAKMKAGILNKIIYPTGGFLELEYESHKFYFDNANREGGGLRVKSTKFKDDVNGDLIQKDYEYTLSNDHSKSSGCLLYLPQFALEQVGLAVTISDLNTLKRKTMLYTTSLGGLGEAQGSHFGYKEVAITQQGNGKRIIRFEMHGMWEDQEDDCTNGDCIFRRTDAKSTMGVGVAKDNSSEFLVYHPKLSDKDNYPYAPNPNYDWNRGQIKEELFFEESDQINPIKKIIHDYSIKEYSKFYAVKSQPLYSKNGSYHDVSTNKWYSVTYAFSKIAKYYNLSAWKVLSNKKEYDYDRTDKTKYTLKETSYKYDSPSHRQITEVSTVNSDNSIKKTEYRYPQDLNNLSTIGYPILGIPDDPICKAYYYMKVRNIHTPIEVLDWNNNSIIDGSLYLFNAIGTNFFNTKVLPLIKYKIDTKNPINNFIKANISNVSSTRSFFNDSRYVLNTAYDAFDQNGNLNMFHKKDDINTSYIWGYNKTQPIAEVKNAKSNEIFFTSYEEDADFSGLAYKCTTDGHSGSQCDIISAGGFNKAIDFPKSNLHGKYVYSAWVKTSGSGTYVSIKDFTNGTTNAYSWTPVPNTYGQWKYFETVANLDDASYNSSNNIRVEVWNSGFTTSYVDDVRFRPFNSQMSTYTYKPLVGITSVTDNLNRTTTYEYDKLGRLLTIKDESGNILNHYEYQYYTTVDILSDCVLTASQSGQCTNDFNISGSNFTYTDYTYDWDFGDGQIQYDSPNSSNYHYYSTEGWYEVTVNIKYEGVVVKTLSVSVECIDGGGQQW